MCVIGTVTIRVTVDGMVVASTRVCVGPAMVSTTVTVRVRRGGGFLRFRCCLPLVTTFGFVKGGWPRTAGGVGYTMYAIAVFGSGSRYPLVHPRQCSTA